jgi:cation transport protein ChaC
MTGARGSNRDRAAMAGTGHELWVFGYGSLMWRPDFAYAERRRARLDGFHRAFCIYSTHHRGSPSRPGLVLALDRGGACEGTVYRVAARDAASVLAYLRARELVNGVYREARLDVALHDVLDTNARALVYVAERAHPSYTGPMALAEQAHLIRGARGVSGLNLDYLINTVRHLRELGIRERQLERLVALTAPHAAHRMPAGHASPAARALRPVVARLPDTAPRMPKGERRRFLYRLRCAH